MLLILQVENAPPEDQLHTGASTCGQHNKACKIKYEIIHIWSIVGYCKLHFVHGFYRTFASASGKLVSVEQKDKTEGNPRRILRWKTTANKKKTHWSLLFTDRVFTKFAVTTSQQADKTTDKKFIAKSFVGSYFGLFNSSLNSSNSLYVTGNSRRLSFTIEISIYLNLTFLFFCGFANRYEKKIRKFLIRPFPTNCINCINCKLCSSIQSSNNLYSSTLYTWCHFVQHATDLYTW